VDPSNDLGEYFDIVEAPTDLILMTATIDTSTGTIDGNAAVSFLKPAPEGGLPIRIFVAKRVVLRNVTVVATESSRPALAILASEQIVVEGKLELGQFGLNVPGGFDGDCAGKPGIMYMNGTNPLVLGGGGGGNVTAGGHGGDVVDETTQIVGYAAGLGGTEVVGETVVPLRGGCPGGGGSQGGGALQLTSLTKIAISGGIDARGKRGASGTFPGGGGAGGSILIEAPTIEIGASSTILLHGGGGGSYSTPLGSEPDYVSLGATCQSSNMCTNGGDGGYLTAGGAIRSDAKPAAALALGPTPTIPFYTGGGGGSIGRLRVNTRDGALELPSTTVITGVSTTGTIGR